MFQALGLKDYEESIGYKISLADKWINYVSSLGFILTKDTSFTAAAMHLVREENYQIKFNNRRLFI